MAERDKHSVQVCRRMIRVLAPRSHAMLSRNAECVLQALKAALTAEHEGLQALHAQIGRHIHAVKVLYSSASLLRQGHFRLTCLHSLEAACCRIKRSS